MKKCYKPESEEEKIGYLVEECGEVMAAVGKSLRWGLESVNPELPGEMQETNYNWILRELKDLKRAVRMVEDILKDY